MRRVLEDEVVPVEPVLCFVGAEWPLAFARPLRFGDVVGLWPERLVELVSTPGPMTVAHTMQLARRLAAALPPA